MKLFLFTLILIFFHSPTWALFTNYNSIIIGDQASGMGGAYTSLGGDASASSFYNPATLTLLKGKSFSAAVGIYKKFDTQYGVDEDFTKAALRVNQGFFRSVPSSTGSVIRYQDWTVALSILVPDYDWYKGEIRSTEEQVSLLNYVDESLWVGSSVARKISKTESAGVTIYYTARNYSSSVTDNQFPDATQATLYTEEKNIKHNALLMILGYHDQFTEKWSWGLSYRLPSYQVSGTASLYQTSIATNPYQVTKVQEESLTTKNRIPSKLSFGVAYSYPKVITLSMDLNYYSPEKFKDIEHESAASEDYRQVTNISGGLEYFFKPWLKMRMGGFTNFASHPDPTEDKQQPQGDRVDQLGFSANLALVAKGGITYTFGGYYTGGRGKSIQRVAGNYEVVNKTQQVFTMLVGTSFLF